MSRFLRIWDTASGEIASELPPVSIFVFAFHPLRDVIAVAGRDNTISLWDIPTGQQLQVLRPSGFVALFTDTLTFSDGGVVLIFGGGTGDIRIWEWESGTVLATVEAHELAVIRVVLSDDETLMVTSDIDGNMALWDYPSMERLATVLTGPVGIESLVMTADKRMVFVLGTDGTIRIWGVPSTE
jgi:WD40 repeat protein